MSISVCWEVKMVDKMGLRLWPLSFKRMPMARYRMRLAACFSQLFNFYSVGCTRV